MWHEALGVDVQILAKEYKSYLHLRADAGSWDVISAGWNADFPDAINFLSNFESSNPQNVGSFKSERFDALLQRAGEEDRLTMRRDLFRQADQLLIDEVVLVPLYFPITRRLVKPVIGGAVISPMNHNYSKYLYLEKNKGQPLS